METIPFSYAYGFVTPVYTAFACVYAYVTL